MSKRTERRAAQRAAHKNQSVAPIPATAPKTLTATASSRHTYDPNYVFQDDPPSEPPTPTEDHSARNRAAINRENAQKSTGPITPQGQAISCLNALKHGLTGNTVLLDSDDAEAYQQRLDAHVEQFKPVTFEERRLVQSIHDAAWRLDRILNLESTIYAKGRIELQFCFGEIPEEQRKSFVQLEIMERNDKKLRNLHIQEGRLQRQRARDIAALKQLTQQRIAEETAAKEDAQTAPRQPSAKPEMPVGFEFSTTEMNSLHPNTPQPERLDEAA
jgi:hypothetical protein